MSAQRRKRLPTDFFDRLLSNQTDDQINDLLSSLVDEQISPVPETVPEEPPRPAPAITGGSYRKGIQQGKIEESIVTRDEELKEETPAADQDLSWEERILRTRQMQDHKITPEKIPPIIDLSEQKQPAADVRISEGIPAVEEENISKIVSVPPPGVHGAPEAPEITEFPRGPEVPLPRQAESSPGIAEVSGKAEDAGKPVLPQAAPETRLPAAPETRLPDEPEVKSPAGPASSALLHKELRRNRIQARWERPCRKPKLPKMAKTVPPITVKPSKLAILDDYLAPGSAREWRKTMTRIRRAALFFLLPAFIAFSLFSWYPMLKGLLLSFLDYQPAGESLFIGIDNYVRAFKDEMFWRTLGHAAGFCILALGLGFWIPIVLAIFINELRWGKGLLKFLFFLPFLMPAVPAAILWKWMMDQGSGLLNAWMALLGAADPHIGWLTNPKLALFSLVLLYIWKNTGWAVLIYSAALGNIDEAVYEEAEIDGATIWDKMRHVTLPALRGVISVMLIITIINTLQLFTEVYIMTNGGPMNSTEFIATYIYKQAFFTMDIGYASALSVLLLIMLLFITIFRLRQLEPEGE